MKLPGIIDLPPHLQQPFADYIRSYSDWRLNGAPDMKPYRRGWGLCDNASPHNTGLGVALANAFKKISGTSFPFGEYNFYQRMIDKTQNLDPARIAYEGEIIKQAKGMGI